MMIVRPANERGHAEHGWLDSYHTFSFAEYHDPNYMGFRALRVLNDDRVAPGKGFAKHPHRDMEIISYVLEGALAHQDSLGTGSVIRPGDVQRMSAGSGVVHSEFNASTAEAVHFLQIWLLPQALGMKPGYEQKTFAREDMQGRLRLVASPDGRDGSVTVHSDAALYAGFFGRGQTAEYALGPKRHAWIHVARGAMRIHGRDLSAGDSTGISEEPGVRLEGADDAEVLVFDLG